jgi:hypothetical protein
MSTISNEAWAAADAETDISVEMVLGNQPKPDPCVDFWDVISQPLSGEYQKTVSGSIQVEGEPPTEAEAEDQQAYVEKLHFESQRWETSSGSLACVGDPPTMEEELAEQGDLDCLHGEHDRAQEDWVYGDFDWEGTEDDAPFDAEATAPVTVSVTM